MSITSIFINFQKLVENFCHSKLKTVYSDGGGEFQGLGSHLASTGIFNILNLFLIPLSS